MTSKISTIGGIVSTEVERNEIVNVLIPEVIGKKFERPMRGVHPLSGDLILKVQAPKAEYDRKKSSDRGHLSSRAHLLSSAHQLGFSPRLLSSTLEPIF